MTERFVVPYPTRLQHVWMKSRLEGPGACRLRAKRQTIEHFKLFDLPRPEPEAGDDPSGKYRVMTFSSAHRVKCDRRYRIAYEERGSRQKPYMVRFGLLGDVNNQTLEVLARHLNSTGVPWLYLCDEHGSRLSRSCWHTNGQWVA